MKIDTDLRLAIKSAAASQPSNNWQTQRQAHRDVIQALFNRKPSLRLESMNAKEKIRKSHKLDEEARAFYNSIGIRSDLDDIHDSAKFIAAGGKLPASSKCRWSYDAVMTEIAAAEPNGLKGILKKYGINWT